MLMTAAKIGFKKQVVILNYGNKHRLSSIQSQNGSASHSHDTWEDNGISEMKSSGNGSDKAIVPQKQSFANVVNGINTKRPTPKVNFRAMVNHYKIANSNFVLPITVVQAVQHKFENSLVGFFVGKKVAFLLVKNYVTNTWAKYGFEKVMSNDDRVLYSTFNSISLVKGVEHGPRARTWHGVEFARALIDVSADKELKQEVIMAIPRGEDENEGHAIEKIRVENKFKPPVCLDCHVFGHTADQCPKKVDDKPMPDVAINDNGFTMVVNRKSKGKGVGSFQKKNFGGFKVNNSKNVVYQHVKPKPNDPKPNNSSTSDPKEIGKEVNNECDSNGIKLKNLFEKLNEITTVVASSSGSGETDMLHTSDLNEDHNADSKSDVEEVFTEEDPKVYHSKGVVRGMPWTLLGDINVALNLEDSYSGSSSLNSAMIEFKDCVANTEPYHISDHSPSVLKIPNLPMSKPKPFKFFNFITHKGKFLDVVANHWNTSVQGHHMFHVTSKLKFWKKPLRKLVHDHGNLHDHVNKLRHELDEVQKALDTCLTDPNLREEEALYVQVFNEAKSDEERFLKQKAKIEWLAVGDSNSIYFHKSLKSRTQRSRIKVIVNSDKIEFSGSCVPDAFVQHYKMFLGTDMHCDDLNCEGLFTKMVLNESRNNMVRSVTDVEIKSAMFSIGDDKSPGPDGYTYHWDKGALLCAFKIDIQKAYDTVDWRFLEVVLKRDFLSDFAAYPFLDIGGTSSKT
ncbi:hypothetical protein Tco_0385152 [Tanacetum coccineum]